MARTTFDMLRASGAVVPGRGLPRAGKPAHTVTPSQILAMNMAMRSDIARLRAENETLRDKLAHGAAQAGRHAR